jgi:hypothetical protein
VSRYEVIGKVLFSVPYALRRGGRAAGVGPDRYPAAIIIWEEANKIWRELKKRIIEWRNGSDREAIINPMKSVTRENISRSSRAHLPVSEEALVDHAYAGLR